MGEHKGTRLEHERKLVNIQKLAKRLAKRLYLGRVSVEMTKRGPDVVIRIGFLLETTAHRVALELLERDNGY